MRSRRGEKVGWICGWLGGFLWLSILSVIWLVQGKTMKGLIGLALFAGAVATICLVTPWRFPGTSYWKLLLVPYALFFGSAVYSIWAYGGVEKTGLNTISLFYLLPILLPVFTMGRRRWVDGEGPPGGVTR
jgi:hypothetical protein